MPTSRPLSHFAAAFDPSASWRATRRWCAWLVLLVAACITAAPRPLLAADDENGRVALDAEIRLWLARHQGVAPQQVEVTPLDSRLVIPECPDGWNVSLPFNNTQSVRARCDSIQPSRQYIVRTSIKALEQEVITAMNLSEGHKLQASDLQLRPTLPGRPAAFTDPRQLVGRVLARDLPSGFSIHMDDLSSHVTVYRLARSTFSGDVLRPQDVLASQLPFENAPPDFWSKDWPDTPIVAQALPAGHILRNEDWAKMVPAVIAVTDIPRATQLTPNMLRIASIPEPSNGVGYVANINQLAYSETTRLIRRGRPISRHDVRAAVLVKRGSTVTITVGRGRGFEISTQVEALEDGRLGEHIRLINHQSGREISGVVTATNQVEAL